MHYDIKPQQMMLDENGRVKINDLNTCQFADADADGNSCPFAMSAVGVGERCVSFTSLVLHETK